MAAEEDEGDDDQDHRPPSRGRALTRRALAVGTEAGHAWLLLGPAGDRAPTLVKALIVVLELARALNPDK